MIYLKKEKMIEETLLIINQKIRDEIFEETGIDLSKSKSVIIYPLIKE